MRYTKRAIESARLLLNQLIVKGTDNAKIVVMIDNILSTPIVEEENGDGDHSEEKRCE